LLKEYPKENVHWLVIVNLRDWLKNRILSVWSIVNRSVCTKLLKSNKMILTVIIVLYETFSSAFLLYIFLIDKYTEINKTFEYCHYLWMFNIFLILKWIQMLNTMNFTESLNPSNQYCTFEYWFWLLDFEFNIYFVGHVYDRSLKTVKSSRNLDLTFFTFFTKHIWMPKLYLMCIPPIKKTCAFQTPENSTCHSTS